MLRLSSHFLNLFWVFPFGFPLTLHAEFEKPYFNSSAFRLALNKRNCTSSEWIVLITYDDHFWAATMHHTHWCFHKRSRYRIICFYYYYEWSKNVSLVDNTATTLSWKTLLLISCRPCLCPVRILDFRRQSEHFHLANFATDLRTSSIRRIGGERTDSV